MRPTATRVSIDWLMLRRAADEHAREPASGLAADLAAFLRTRRPQGQSELVDVGAGTGSGAEWLAARITGPQRWRLIDHDSDLLARAKPAADGWAEPVIADLLSLATILTYEPADAVTCQALLDLLTMDDLRALLEPAISCGAAVLASLTVNGVTHLTPAHPDDEMVVAAFNAHQRRGGRLGPDAAGAAANILRAAGYVVTSAATPWRLGLGEEALIEEWLRGRAHAATEQLPDSAGRIRQWFNDQMTALHGGGLSAVVDHLDVLGLPPE
ncbi:MAG: methyltransferase domain-containing protein [Nakamurella sp.]